MTTTWMNRTARSDRKRPRGSSSATQASYTSPASSANSTSRPSLAAKRPAQRRPMRRLTSELPTDHPGTTRDGVVGLAHQVGGGGEPGLLVVQRHGAHAKRHLATTWQAIILMLELSASDHGAQLRHDRHPGGAAPAARLT